MPIPTDEERIGTIVAEKYALTAILGRGGMGTVFRAVHNWTQRPVAVKFLHADYARDEDVVRRFLREARAAASLRHPNAVDVLDMGEDANAGVYMVLEFLEGKSLADHLAERRTLGLAETLRLLLPVMDALAAAHARGIVHRDIKPENVFLAVEGANIVPKLLDFGIAKVQDGTGAGTQTGVIIGTPAYMSPEQAQGSSSLGPATDIWALGVVLYECLSGALPYSAETPTGILVKIITEAPAPLETHRAELAGPLSTVIARALAKDPAARYASVPEFAQTLRAVADQLLGPGHNLPAATVAELDATHMSDPPHFARAPGTGVATPSTGAYTGAGTPAYADAGADRPVATSRMSWTVGGRDEPNDRSRSPIGLLLAGVLLGVGVASGFLWWRTDASNSTAADAASSGPHQVEPQAPTPAGDAPMAAAARPQPAANGGEPDAGVAQAVGAQAVEDQADVRAAEPTREPRRERESRAREAARRKRAERAKRAAGRLSATETPTGQAPTDEPASVMRVRPNPSVLQPIAPEASPERSRKPAADEGALPEPERTGKYAPKVVEEW